MIPSILIRETVFPKVIIISVVFLKPPQAMNWIFSLEILIKTHLIQN